MAEDTTGGPGADSGESADAPNPRADAQSQAQTGRDTTPQNLRTQDGKTWTLAEAVARINEMARENRTYHQRAQTAEQERDSLRQERDSLLSESRKRTVRDGALREAEGAKARMPGVVADLIDLDAVDFDDKGKPTNLAKLIETIRKRHPDLFAAGNADGGSRGGAPGPDMNTIIRRAAGRG